MWVFTTEGSALSPEPLAALWSGVPHHLCVFPVIAEVAKAVVGAVTRERKRRAATHPTLPQGRPTTQAAQAAARKNKRHAPQRVDVYPHRDLVVPQPLSCSARQRLWRITRGLPQWRTRRELMAQVSALGDRRCRTQSALDTLDHLRRRLLRFTQCGETLKQRCSPTVEKALTVLDATLFPSTSHAVERGNRR